MHLRDAYRLTRRHIFPAILVGAAMMCSVIGASLKTPVKSFDYLDEMEVMPAEQTAISWVDNSDLAHADKLTSADIESLKKLAEGKMVGSDRDVYLGQARREVNSNRCAEPQDKCIVEIQLNRELSPNYVHGDLRLISLIDTSLVNQIETSPEGIRKTDAFIQSRQLRFILTEYGWVQTTSELLKTAKFKGKSSFDPTTTKFSGLNYYPKSAPWDEFWAEYPRAEIKADLKFVRSLGANSLRIFINHAYFTHVETSDNAIEKLTDFLNLSAEQDLKVILTMFDLRSDYRLGNWSQDSAHLSSIIDVTGHHEALLAIDLKNEADLDFDRSGESQVTAWLEAMIESARYGNANIPLTIGWSDPSHAERLSDKLDVISYHDYQPAKTIGARLSDVKDKVGNKPVYLTEIGSSRWAIIGDNKDRQAEKLLTQLSKLDAADGVMIWTLHDSMKSDQT